MILYNIGNNEMTVGELTLRGRYLGSNVSCNVKKMLENGYIARERSPHGRRAQERADMPLTGHVWRIGEPGRVRGL